MILQLIVFAPAFSYHTKPWIEGSLLAARQDNWPQRASRRGFSERR